MTWLFITSTLLTFIFLTLWLLERGRTTSLSRMIVDSACTLRIVPFTTVSPALALRCMVDTIIDLRTRLDQALEELRINRALMEEE